VYSEGVSAWEARYGLLQPIRPDGGFRLDTAEDAERVTRMKRAFDEGLAGFALGTVLRELILPALREVGAEWERGEIEVGSLLESEAGELRRLGRSAPLVLSGAGASEGLCRRLRLVERLDGDLAAGADAVASGN
jgi:hypothetical protein